MIGYINRVRDAIVITVFRSSLEIVLYFSCGYCCISPYVYFVFLDFEVILMVTLYLLKLLLLKLLIPLYLLLLILLGSLLELLLFILQILKYSLHLPDRVGGIQDGHIIY